MTTPKLFLTDYASYNNGTQFEFGHWVDMTNFADEVEFADYMTEHFKSADKKSPLPGGSIREEPMFTDYENFPSALYSESGDLKDLFEYINFDDDKKILVAALMELEGFGITEAIEGSDDRYIREFDRWGEDKYNLFNEYFPEADKADDNCNYLSIDYDRFIEDCFLEFESNGATYLIDRQ